MPLLFESREQIDAVTRKRSAPADALCVAFLFAAALSFYWKVLRLWWCLDDFYQLHFVSAHGPGKYLLDPAVWQQLPTRMLTPLLFASLDLDRHLFGLRPRLFYAHQLIAFVAAMVCLYFAIRIWFEPLWAAAGTSIIMLGTPSSSMVQQLMQRHYVEGLALASLCVILFVAASRSGSVGLMLACLAAYLGCALAKEIFVPLPILMLALPVERTAARRRTLVGLLVMIAAYAGWRRFMLGTFGGGYAWVVTPGDYPRLLLELPRKLALALSGGRFSVAGVALLFLLISLSLSAIRNRPALILAAVAVIASVAPVLPASTMFENRYALGLSVVLALGFIAGCRMWSLTGRHRLAIILAVASLLLAALVNRQDWRVSFRSMEAMSAEGKGFVTLGKDDILAHPHIPPAAMSELGWMKGELHGVAGSDWYYDDIRLCAEPIAGKRIWRLDGANERIEERTAEIAEAARSHCSALRTDAPLSARFQYADGVLAWELGPYDSGAYAFVLANGRVRYDMPARQRFRLGELPGIALRVRYESPQGWVTYSPELQLDFQRQRYLAWRR